MQLFAATGGVGNRYFKVRAIEMTKEDLSASKTFVKQMRVLAKNRDLESIRQAVQQMRAWIQNHPDDLVVGTALEEFDILEESATLIEERKKQATVQPVQAA